MSRSRTITRLLRETAPPNAADIVVVPHDIVSRYDLLVFMLRRGHVDLWQFQVGRQFQFIYLASLIQPPRCMLGKMDEGKGFGVSRYSSNVRADIPWPAEGIFQAIKKMSRISSRLEPTDWRAAVAIFCKYSLEDEGAMSAHKRTIHKHPRIVADLLNKLGWAMGMTTANPYRHREAA